MAPPRKGDLSDAEKKLLEVILKGGVEEIKALLKEEDVRVDFLDQTGMTPLQHAAFKGQTDICEVFLAHGANVNSNYHDNGYSTLMFAALSGNTDTTRLVLQAGAKISHINSVNRTATQMAAFVGQHQCVSVINNFFPKEDLDYYTVPRGLEKEPKLPQTVAPSLLTLINSVNMHPVKLSLYLRDHKEIIEESYKAAKVLDIIVEKSMKAREPNDVVAIKMHYIATVIRLAAKAAKEKDGDLDPWIKSLLKGREGDGFPEKQERLIRQALKEFPYVESQLLQNFVRQLAPVKIGDDPTALFMLMSGINGQQFGWNEESSCATCGEQNPEKKCSACSVAGYCNQDCQKRHWFAHKKICKQLAAEYARREKARKKRDEEQAKKEAEMKKAQEEKEKEEISDISEKMKDVDVQENTGAEDTSDKKEDSDDQSTNVQSRADGDNDTTVSNDNEQSHTKSEVTDTTS